MTENTWESIKVIIATMQIAIRTENFKLLSSMNYEMYKIIKEVKENEKTHEEK